MRDALICLSPWSRDGRGVVVRHAAPLAGAGVVFCRFEQKILINGPMPGKTYPDVVGWIAEEDAGDLLSHGEFRKVEVAEVAESESLDVKPPAPDATEAKKRFLPQNVNVDTPQEE